MLPLPKTPSKVDDGIERLKQSLSTKWGIRFPVRNPTPSKRDRSLVEERILGLIQFLYFKEGALDYAIEQFEKNAVQIVSQWHFKPHGDPDVLPSLAHSESALRQDFLKKQRELSPQAVKELTESLKYFLSLAVEQVKAGDKFPSSRGTKDKPTATNEASPTKPDLLERQSSLGQWLQSESGPIQAWQRQPPVQLPSSDDYPDHEIAELLANADVLEDSPIMPLKVTNASKTGDLTGVDHCSSSDDIFETPPSSPPHRESSSTAPSRRRKRSCSDSMQAPPPRNVSRKTSGGESAQELIYQDGLNPVQPVVLSNRTSTKTNPSPSYDYPRQTAQNRSTERGLVTSFGSFEKPPSITSSVTSASSASTSTNTSFSVGSLATSFDSSIDGNDPAKIAYRANPPFPPSLPFSVPELKNDLANRYENEACKISAGNISDFPDPMDIDSEDPVSKHAPQAEPVDLQNPLEPRTDSALAGELLAERLRENPPFVQAPDHYPSIPFRQLYEIIRVASACKLKISEFFDCFQTTFTSYDSLWSSLSSITRANGAQIPERSSLVAWDRASSDFEGVALTGKLKLLDQPKGQILEFQLHPLKLEPSYRLSRQFGSDRFCVMGMPGLGLDDLPSHLKSYHTSAREIITNWLVDTDHRFLGRTWRAFYTKAERPKSKGKRHENTSRFKVYLFAEDGVGFQDSTKHGELDPRLLDRPRINVREMMEWFLPFKTNLNQPLLKFFARLALGVSSTVPTVIFEPSEIFRADDARADNPRQWHLSYKRSDEKKRQRNPSKSNAPIMNDGCARISRKAARAVADCLCLDYVPCVFQGRIGGAKGIWMIDAQDETPTERGRNYWIEITDSQLKFEGHAKDEIYPEPGRVTFEVNAWATKLSSGSLRFQLLPILLDRGVPPNVFETLLDKDLTARVGELEVAMDSGLALRKWNQENNPTTAERARYGGIEMHGGLPSSTAERINWFTEHGFHPKTCRFLKDQLHQAILAYCLKVESKMHIRVGQSTSAYMIADPLAILEENEIHLGFSSIFHDPRSGFDQSMLHNIDVLVARSPAHLPSDVQKVRAVFKPDLMMYRDVIVFPSKGSVSLASKLSGGDYDGDQAWVCWDPAIVQPFTNADVPPSPTLESYGIEKDTSTVADIVLHHDYLDTFLRHSFKFNLQANMLAKCSIYHESYCYHKKAIDSAQAISIAVLLGILVDSAKGGFRFDEAKWRAYLKKNELPRILTKPAFKDPQRGKPKDNLIDHLVFVVAKRVREKALHEFDKRFGDISPRDHDLSRIRDEEHEEAKNNKPLASVLKNLEIGLKDINTFWSVHARPENLDEEIRPSRKSGVMTFTNLVERCRADFLSLKPTLDNHFSSEASDRISSWQLDHSHGRSSYWDLLKASVAFHLYYKSNFVWHIAGIELAEIKATACGRGSYRTVVGDVFEAFKLDKKVADRAMRKDMIEKEGGSRVLEGVEEDEDEFGAWDWGFDDC